MKNTYTVVVMSSTQNKVRQFSIGRWSLRFLYLLFFAIIAVAAGGIAYGILFEAELQDLHTENKQLNENIESHRKQLNYLDKEFNEEMREIRQMVDMVRNVLGLNPKKGILGQGGDGADTEEVNEDVQTGSVLEAQSPVLEIHTDLTNGSPTTRILQLKREIEPIYEHVKGKIKEYSQRPSILPVAVQTDGKRKSYWYSSGYGYRIHPLTKRRTFHHGLDISARKGTRVIAAADGVVELAQTDRLLGRMIRVRHEAAQMKTLYGHLNKFAKGIRKGKTVKRGETIGYVGNTGQSTGTHLHYGVYTKDGWTNPINYILDAVQNP